MVMIIVHVFTCVYWIIKSNCALDQSEVDKFLSDRQLDKMVRAWHRYPLFKLCISCITATAQPHLILVVLPPLTMRVKVSFTSKT